MIRAFSKTTVALFACGLLLCTEFDHAGAGPPTRFGIEGGFGYTILDYRGSEMETWTPDGRFNFSGGAFAELLFWDGKIHVAPGLRLLRVANKVDVNTGVDPVSQLIGEFEITQNYLSVPIILKYKPAHNAGFFMLSGMEFGYLLSAKRRSVIREIQNETTIVIFEDVDEDVKDRMESYNVSGMVGVGQQRAVRGHVVTAQLRYNYGFVDVAKADEWFATWRTRVFEFVLGFAW